MKSNSMNMSQITLAVHEIKYAVALALVFALPGWCVGQSRANPRVPATVQAYESADMYAKVSGYLKSVAVNIGDEVKTGDVLAEIDVPEMALQLVQKEAQLALAEAQAAQAEARIEEAKSHLKALEAGINEAQSMRSQKQALYDFERTECERLARLVASGSIQAELIDAARYKMQAAQSEVQSVDAKVATAKANLSGGKAAVRRSIADAKAAVAKVAVAQADIKYVEQLQKYATIRAPWDGKISQRMYDAGAFVQSAEGNSGAKPILKLIRDDKVRVVFSLSQKDIANLAKGTKVVLSDIDALPGESFTGEVSRFSSALDGKTRMLKVEMDLDNAGELSLNEATPRLKPGFFGYATVHVHE